MGKWAVYMNGELDSDDFDTEEEAEEYVNYCHSCEELGNEMIRAGNPYAYFDEDSGEVVFEVKRLK